MTTGRINQVALATIHAQGTPTKAQSQGFGSLSQSFFKSKVGLPPPMVKKQQTFELGNGNNHNTHSPDSRCTPTSLCLWGQESNKDSFL
jgi:hypothetical protein